jgi:DNA-binding winged helix-turn-helix (wHTH) protein
VYFPPFRLDLDGQLLWRGTERVALRPKAFTVLRYLTDNAGRLVGKDELLDFAWPDTTVNEEAVAEVVRELRRALGDEQSPPRFIETVYGKGFRFVAPVGTDEHTPSGDPVSALAPLVRDPSLGTVVGRGSELAQLEEHLRIAVAGRRQVAFIEGEPGSGCDLDPVTRGEGGAGLVADGEVRVARGDIGEGIRTERRISDGGRQRAKGRFGAAQIQAGAVGSGEIAAGEEHEEGLSCAEHWRLSFLARTLGDRGSADPENIPGTIRKSGGIPPLHRAPLRTILRPRGSDNAEALAGTGDGSLRADDGGGLLRQPRPCPGDVRAVRA